MSAALRRLKSGGIRIGVFTAAPLELARIAVSHLGAERHVEIVEAGPGAEQRACAALGEGVQVLRTREELLAVP
jgi:phosphoglycolate phosphatase-like HAD superfamily hydrolase